MVREEGCKGRAKELRAQKEEGREKGLKGRVQRKSLKGYGAEEKLERKSAK